MHRRFFLGFLPMIFLIGLLTIFITYRQNPPYFIMEYNQQIDDVSIQLVQIEFFVMSRCPDAAFCEKLFLPYLIQLSSIVNFTLSFIGSKSSSNQFECMHGENECLGNRQQLCIQSMYSPMIFLNYILCQSSDITNIPNNGEECAKNTSQSTINWSNVQTCVNSKQSDDLFNQTLERTRLAQAKKSCTIHMNGKLWCIHDRYWYNCSEGSDGNSFIKAICSRYHGNNRPKECTIVQMVG